MTVTVATATPEHTPAMLELLAEMNQFYGDSPDGSAEERAGQLRAALFSDPPAAYALLAFDGDKVIGIACYSFLWPAVGLTRSLYLKELYVVRSRWRTGVGTSLMRAVFEVAVKHECSRVEWTADLGNGSAQKFYADLGFQQLDTKVFFRAEGTANERDPHTTPEQALNQTRLWP